MKTKYVLLLMGIANVQEQRESNVHPLLLHLLLLHPMEIAVILFGYHRRKERDRIDTPIILSGCGI